MARLSKMTALGTCVAMQTDELGPGWQMMVALVTCVSKCRRPNKKMTALVTGVPKPQNHYSPGCEVNPCKMQ